MHKTLTVRSWKEIRARLPSWLMWRRVAAGVLLLTPLVAANAQVGCLTTAQQIELLGRNERLLSQFDVMGDLQRSSDLHKRLATLRPSAKACANRTPLDLSLARLTDECQSTIADYNAVVDETIELDEQIKFKQQSLLNQLNLERGRYSPC